MGLCEPAAPGDHRDRCEVRRRRGSGGWIDDVVAGLTANGPSPRAGTRGGDTATAHGEGAQVAVGRVGLFEGDQPSVGIGGSAGHGEITADADEGAVGSVGEEFGDGQISGEPLADAAGIDDDTGWHGDFESVWIDVDFTHAAHTQIVGRQDREPTWVLDARPVADGHQCGQHGWIEAALRESPGVQHRDEQGDRVGVDFDGSP